MLVAIKHPCPCNYSFGVLIDLPGMAPRGFVQGDSAVMPFARCTLAQTRLACDRQECVPNDDTICDDHKSITLARVSSQILQECANPDALKSAVASSATATVTSNGTATERSIASRSLPRRWAHSCLRKAMQTNFFY